MSGDETVLLRDGEAALIRPFVAADGEALVDLLGRLSRETLRLRFHSAGADVAPQRLLGGDGTRAYVARVGGRLAGVASYALLTDPRLAEMAVAVADDEHGRGVGTLLFERIARDARGEGIDRMVALVLAENRAMLALLGALGFGAERRLDSGEIEVTLRLQPDERYRDASDARQHVASARSLERIFRPRSIAVVGASRRPGTIGDALFRNLRRGGYPGPIYAINPNASSIAGAAAFPTVTAAPGPVDLALVCVPAASVIEVSRDAIAAGVAALVVISAGFAERSAEGAERQEALRRLCRDAGVRLVGPNCMGVLTNAPGLVMNATFVRDLPRIGSVAVSVQSGALGIAILEHARALGIGISAFASIGNKADVSSNDLLEAWEDDPQTEVIALYLESFGNPRRFGRIARRIAACKPIVCVKGGRSGAGARAARSHTAALAASDVAVDALFRQAGVIRTDTLQELFETVRLLSSQPLPAGARVGVVSNAGGLGILCADACDAAGLELPALAETSRAALRGLLPEAAAPGNPVQLAASEATGYVEAMQAVHDDPGVDAVIVLFVPPLLTTPDAVAAAIREAVDGGAVTKPLLACFVSAEGEPASLNPPGSASTIPAYPFPEAAARALGHAAGLAAFRRRPRGAAPELDVDALAARAVCERALARVPGPDPAWLDPGEVAELLAAYGIRTSGPAAADARASQGIECLVGVTTDPTFGQLVAFGLGGVATELIGDVAFRIAPLSDRDADELIDSVRARPLLDGYRGEPAGDVGAVRDVLLRISRLVDDVPLVAELDLDPLVALPPGAGAVARDARVRVARP